MAVNDPVADFLTHIRNGLQAAHTHVEMPASKLRAELARILEEQGYIASWSIEPARVGQALRIELKYTDGRHSAITGLERVSRPGRRRYVGSHDIPKVLGGMGTAIISTSTGVMTGHDARRRGVGGEVMAYVW